ncbi:hypothetical protein [Thermococcus barophilus]|uniref:Uncharacterized protein n=1 Tax=Thermococcus barophilus TaxID=55802 RepID=A0A0S1XAK8_THEBA|nr:hypothetical protein [Thermococcus barophilus]ALM74807.1 hypothetical protein TBCH5v1_0854 [Thermococcus barophilus]
MEEWKERLKEEGYIEVGDFIIEVSVDSECPCKDDEVYPVIMIYDRETESWYYVDEPFDPVNNFTEAWEEGIKVLRDYINGREPRLKRTPKKFAPDDVIKRFAEALKTLENKTDSQSKLNV